jgi:HlyD family secretion protein
MSMLLPASKDLSSQAVRSLRNHAFAGLGTLALLVGCLGGWMATTSIAGAVVASGFISVTGGSKLIQHPEGGIVREILAHDGDSVKSGDVLVRLDDVVARSEFSIVTSQLRDALARQARLTAESVQSDTIVLPALAANWPPDPELSGLLGDQARLHQSRKASLGGRVSQIEQQISQQNEQIAGLLIQKEAVQAQVELLVEDENRLQNLLTQGLTEGTRVSDVRRTRAEMEGELGRLTAAVASTRSSIAELEVGRVQLADNFQAEVLQELASVSQLTQELLQRRAAAEARLERLEIRAPVDGVVYQSAVQTEGGIVAGGETIMQVVPGGDQQSMDVRLSPLDIDKVFVGQGVSVRFSGLDARSVPELAAQVTSIAPDLTREPNSGVQYYGVKVSLNSGEPDKLPTGTSLVPGMPADVFIQTGDRTVLSYLFAPIAEQMNRAMRD